MGNEQRAAAAVAADLGEMLTDKEHVGKMLVRWAVDGLVFRFDCGRHVHWASIGLVTTRNDRNTKWVTTYGVEVTEEAGQSRYPVLQKAVNSAVAGMATECVRLVDIDSFFNGHPPKQYVVLEERDGNYVPA